MKKMATRVSYQALADFLNIIKQDFDVDIRLYKQGRYVTIMRYEAYAPNQPSVLRCNGNAQALSELKQIHASLFGCA